MTWIEEQTDEYFLKVLERIRNYDLGAIKTLSALVEMSKEIYFDKAYEKAQSGNLEMMDDLVKFYKEMYEYKSVELLKYTPYGIEVKCDDLTLFFTMKERNKNV